MQAQNATALHGKNMPDCIPAADNRNSLETALLTISILIGYVVAVWWMRRR